MSGVLEVLLGVVSTLATRFALEFPLGEQLVTVVAEWYNWGNMSFWVELKLSARIPLEPGDAARE